MWDAVKTVLRGKSIALNTYIKKEGSQINYVTFHHKKLKKEEQCKSKEKERNDKEQKTMKLKRENSRGNQLQPKASSFKEQ